MVARILKPAKNAMQSGRANSRKWILEFEPEAEKHIDPLMGWTGSADMDSQVRLRFETKEDAVAYAERNGLEFEVIEPRLKTTKIRSYADNFRFDAVR